MLRTIAVSTVLLLAAAGALAADKPAADPAKPDPRIGAETGKICFARNIDGWKEIDGVDGAVLLETGVRKWHYVTLSGACEARLFRFAQTIGIENRPAGGCVRQGDVIIVNDTGNFTRRCFIRKIYEWNDDLPVPDEAAKESSPETK